MIVKLINCGDNIYWYDILIDYDWFDGLYKYKKL